MKITWEEVDSKEPYNEKHFLDDISWRHPVLGRALQKHGFNLDALRRLPVQATSDTDIIHTIFTVPDPYGEQCRITWRCWHDLLDIPHIGPVRLLELVNYLRNNKVELPWFVAFDVDSEQWKALQGRYRTKKVCNACEGER